MPQMSNAKWTSTFSEHCVCVRLPGSLEAWNGLLAVS